MILALRIQSETLYIDREFVKVMNKDLIYTSKLVYWRETLRLEGMLTILKK